jgi:hypothetical protein
MADRSSGSDYKLFISMPFAALAQASLLALVVWALLASFFGDAWKIAGLVGLLIALGLWRFSWRELAMDEASVRFTTAFSKDEWAIAKIVRVQDQASASPFPRQALYFLFRGPGLMATSVSIGLLDRGRARRWADELNKRLKNDAPVG